MLKFQQVINMGIASILVIPAVALQGDRGQGLEAALEDTIAALDHLVRVRDTRDVADPETREMIVAATEAPIAAGPQRDQYLDTLRRDVNVLTMQLESVEQSPKQRQMIQGSSNAPQVDFNGTGRTSQPTTGLSEQERRNLAGIQAPLPGVNMKAPIATIAIEEDGFVVDRLLLGQSYYRAGRYLESAEILSRQPGNAEAVYWYARCLEKLERFDEAIDLYGSVLKLTESTYLADRARNDLEFLTWKREFQSKINSSKQGQ